MLYTQSPPPDVIGSERHCQNYDISQRRKIEGTEMSPSQVAQTALDYGADGIAYTYNEPSIFIEFARDCGIEARKRGLFNIFVSNGFDTPDSVNLMDQFLDCITVDFKGSGKQEFVRQYIGIPSADPVFQTLKEIHARTSIHTEVTDLIVPQVGDDSRLQEDYVGLFTMNWDPKLQSTSCDSIPTTR